jgi:hypothetical protein
MLKRGRDGGSEFHQREQTVSSAVSQPWQADCSRIPGEKTLALSVNCLASTMHKDRNG